MAASSGVERTETDIVPQCIPGQYASHNRLEIREFKLAQRQTSTKITPDLPCRIERQLTLDRPEKRPAPSADAAAGMVVVPITSRYSTTAVPFTKEQRGGLIATGLVEGTVTLNMPTADTDLSAANATSVVWSGPKTVTLPNGRQVRSVPEDEEVVRLVSDAIDLPTVFDEHLVADEMSQ